MIEGSTRLVIELPALTTDEAALIAEIFEQVVAQIWEHHGEHLIHHQLADRSPDVRSTEDSDLPF